jgi:hypothetical protein
MANDHVQVIPQSPAQLKLFDDSMLTRSVVDTPTVRENLRPGGSPGTLMLYGMASMADVFPEWGYDVKGRDIELRNFFPKEPLLSSAVYSVSVRNASFEWEIVGSDQRKPKPIKTIATVEKILRNSNRGLGWSRMMVQLCIDLYSQDNGGFIEVVRAADDPRAPVLNLAHLDSYRCTRTGDPEIPVIYEDRMGRPHQMKNYQVITVEEFPSPIETMFGVQYCAITRALLAAQIIRDIAVYKHEKISGNFSRALHIVSGVPQSMIDDAMVYAQNKSLNTGLTRYSQPTIMASIDPSHPLSHVQLDLASLPEGFDEEVTLKWYITQLAAAFGVDYQEFAPLPGGNLGSSQEAEILHLKTRGKGPAAIMSLIEHIINENRLIPENVKFRFKQHDVTAEKDKAESRFTRAKERSMRIKSGEIDVQAARRIAVEDGDLPDFMVEEIEEREEEERLRMEEEMRTQMEMAGNPNEPQNDPLTADQVEGGSTSHQERAYGREAIVTHQSIAQAKEALAFRLLERQGA